jgi:tetratricopeptide (TPR) repeat protein
VYRSELIFTHLQIELERAISALQQSIVEININSKYNDIPLILAESQNRDKTLFFVTGLRWGGGRGRKKAYQALNVHREYLIDCKVRAIFWLTPKEAASLPRYAPDFWAFRHRVFEFLELPCVDDVHLHAQDILLGKWNAFTDTANIDQEISSYEEMLSGLPPIPESFYMEAEYRETIGALLWAKGAYSQALKHLEKGLSIAENIHDRNTQARYLNCLGILHQSMKNYRDGVESYKKVIELSPNDYLAWSNLASTYMAMGHFKEALNAVNQATKSHPKNSESWLVKGNIYYNLGCYEDAVAAYQHVIRLAPGDIRSGARLGEILSRWGNRKLVSRYFTQSRKDLE